MIYRLRYCNKDGVEARVDIQKGLATPIIDIEGTERPFILSYSNDKGDKSGMFLSSSADIEIYETPDFNIDNLKTSNETELSVTHYINNVVSWKGFIIPDFFSIEVRNNPIITMTASDRLGTLKSVMLSDLPSMVNIRELALTCLSKTGLTLPLKTMADFSNDDTDNAFFSYYIDSQRIKDIKGRSISCYDILSSILIASNSKLVQRAGEWVIINKLQHEIGSGKIYSSLSSFTNYLENIYNFEEVSIGARRTIMPVAGSVGIYHEHGGRKSHPANYDYSLGLSGWNSVNGFVATIENRHITFFLGGLPFFDPDRTVKQYLLNYNNSIDSTKNLNTAPYITTDAIQINSPRADRVEVTVDISSIMAEKLSSDTAISFLRYAVILTNGVKTYTLTKAGIFEILDPKNISGHSLLLRGGQQHPLMLASPAFSNSDSFKALFEVGEDDDVNSYSATIRVYGSGNQYVTVNYALIKFSDVSELPKGTMYKTEQGEVFTKAYDIDTSIFGDYLLSGLDGYFYRYPNDDTSSIYKDVNTLSTPVWTTPNIANETSELPLLHHSMRQMRRMFSVAHDLLSAEIEASNFDPLAIFVSCGKRYTVVSAKFDFFKSNLSVELEEVAFQSVNVRDFIYSYFGDGESGIKSIGGVSGGSGGGGTGGGMTADQVAILSEVQDLAHEHGNKGVLDQVTQEVVDKALREMLTTESESEATDENLMSALRVLREITESSIGLDDKYLSKKDDDTAAGHITLNDGFTSKSHSYIEAPLDVDKKLTAKGGIKFGENYAPGLTGVGGLITEDARAFLRSLSLTEFLEAPEYRFNRIDVIAGDLWNTKGAGIIEEVDTVNQIITLKLEKGEVGRFRYDDIVMGIFHSFNDEDNSVDDYDDGIGNRRYSGFGTSYFRVTQILDAERYSKFRYELRPISPRHSKQFHPQPFMTSAQYGNFTNAERQTSMYQTTSYIRLLRNVNNWEFGIENIGMQWGDMSNLSIFGLDMTGYSAYMENVYFSGIIHQLSAKIKEQLDAQRVGGKNLLREYDIRFGFKYWGNSGEFTEFDMNMIESTPQLQVQPNTLNWTFPIRYGTVVVTANGVWNITTPNWVNAFPAVGSGNKNVDLKAGEYKGRNARVGTVAVQSGVIQRNVSISQAGLTEFVTIDPILNVGYGAQTVTITGKSNSRKLTFTTDTGYLEINLPAQYKVNGTNVNNGSLIAGDPGALDEYSFSITVAIGENVEEFSIQNNIFATAEGGQKAISTIVQRRTRIKVLADTDNSVISIGDMIFHIN